MKSLEFSYDPEKDIITIEGVPYDGELFRYLGSGKAVGSVFRINREDGCYIFEQGIYPGDRNNTVKLINGGKK